MDTDQPVQSNYQQTAITLAQASNRYIPREEPDSTPAIAGALFLIPLCLVVIWSIAIFLVVDQSKAGQIKEKRFKQAERLPCRQCRFYTSNPYLKCAVHPSIVMTSKAIDCSDYRPREESNCTKV